MDIMYTARPAFATQPADKLADAVGPSPSSSSPARPRSHSRSSSQSSARLGRSASLRDTIPDLSTPHTKATPPRARRRSSAAGFSGGLSAVALAADGGRQRGVDVRTARSRSPHPSLLPAAVYTPAAPAPLALPLGGPSTSQNTTVSSSGVSTPALSTPSALHAQNPHPDYFSSKSQTSAPPPPPQSSSPIRPPSRSRPDRALVTSPLGSPPIGVLESEARYRRPAGPSTNTNTRERRHNKTPSRDHDPRHRSESTASTRLDETGFQGTPPRTRERREKDKKTMLSRALQKANTAVLLDNAQNFEGAMEAYSDACKLLQQVMVRSSGEEDRRKLDSIRITYTNRIEELRRLDPGYHPAGKSLPARPMSNESLDEQRSMLLGDADDEPAIIGTASAARIINDRSVDGPEQPPYQSLSLRPSQPGGVRESVISSAIRDVQRTMPDTGSSFHLQPPPGRLGDGLLLGAPGHESLESPMDRSYMPPPLSPRRPLSPLPPAKQEAEPPPFDTSSKNTLAPPPERSYQPLHKRGNSSESTSWLDTIDESGGSSCSSSVHSLSPGGLRRKHIRPASGATEAEFDAALDAAVEAAYDEGYEPYEEEAEPNSADILATRVKNVELAKERVREAEREEVIAAAKYRFNESQMRNQSLPHVRESAEFDFQDEAEEEERLLDEITNEYMLDGFNFDLDSKSALPRQSDSSGFSGTTWNSSVSSHRTTGGTSLSTVSEVFRDAKQKAPVHLPPPVPPPTAAMPSVPGAQQNQANENDLDQTTPKPSSLLKETVSVRSRRLSGQNARILKIETSLPPVPTAPHTEKPTVPDKESRADIPPLPKTATTGAFSYTQNATDPTFRLPALPQVHQPSGLRAPSPQPPIPSPIDTTFTISPATPALNHAISNDSTLVPSSPKTSKGSTLGIRKNKSSLSLKQRTLSISSPDGSDASIGTPLSTTFSFTGTRKQSIVAPAPTPSIPTFNIDGLPSGGMHLFESDIHSPYSPGSPSGTVANAPIPLEPCPDSYLLRPFWLMRCFYQTIVHPRGGYLSTKLFIPRDVWRVKGVKLKNLDDKIANCDLLTAALQRLGTVDTLDADAVLEEMQALEVVLDQVQTHLAKKLGNDVGVHGVSTLFKDATAVGTGSVAGDGSEKGSHGSQDHAPKSAVAQGKSYLASWRKLRSKNSALGLNTLAGAKAGGGEVPKDSLTMATLPMTSLPNIRFAKRDIQGVVFEGPNSGYMGSLARLFDAAQILDQIARQVEDPGLKHSSPTHVGLELSARHAAEFFGFYICRFVLTDITLMLDKFIKRGSEWVLV